MCVRVLECDICTCAVEMQIKGVREYNARLSGAMLGRCTYKAHLKILCWLQWHIKLGQFPTKNFDQNRSSPKSYTNFLIFFFFKIGSGKSYIVHRFNNNLQDLKKIKIKTFFRTSLLWTSTQLVFFCTKSDNWHLVARQHVKIPVACMEGIQLGSWTFGSKQLQSSL